LRPDSLADWANVGGMRLLQYRPSARRGEHAIAQRPSRDPAQEPPRSRVGGL